MKTMEIKITDERAVIMGMMGYVWLTEENYGLRCSEKALNNLKNSASNVDTIVSIYNYEPVWLSIEEFKQGGFKEFHLTEEFFIGGLNNTTSCELKIKNQKK